MNIYIDYQTENLIEKYKTEKKYIDERVEEYKNLLEIYQNISDCYTDNLKALYIERIKRSWAK